MLEGSILLDVESHAVNFNQSELSISEKSNYFTHKTISDFVH